jgi:arylsulfatase A
MTGQYNVRNYTRFGKLDRSQVSFGNLLKKAGYKTAVAGKWQLGKEDDSPQHFGFDTSCLWQQSLPRTDEEGHDTRYSNPVLESNGEVKRYTNGEFGPDIVSDFICDFIEEQKDRPFFVYYPMILTHCPFIPTPVSGDYNPSDPGSLSYKGTPEYFPDMVSYMDRLVGKIVKKINDLGIEQQTLIIFTGDNGTDQPIVSMLWGEEYPGGKGSTKDNGTHVPLIMCWEGTIETGAECNDLIDFSDFLPTICDITGTDVPMHLPIDGISFFPQLKGETGDPREWVYCWYSRSGKVDKLKEIARSKNYKLYTSGAFYNVRDDFYEKEPLSINGLDTEEKEIYTMLSEVLHQYENTRQVEF